MWYPCSTIGSDVQHLEPLGWTQTHYSLNLLESKFDRTMIKYSLIIYTHWLHYIKQKSIIISSLYLWFSHIFSLLMLDYLLASWLSNHKYPSSFHSYSSELHLPPHSFITHLYGYSHQSASTLHSEIMMLCSHSMNLK